jgi:hypothetical protein
VAPVARAPVAPVAPVVPLQVVLVAPVVLVVPVVPVEAVAARRVAPVAAPQVVAPLQAAKAVARLSNRASVFGSARRETSAPAFQYQDRCRSERKRVSPVRMPRGPSVPAGFERPNLLRVFAARAKPPECDWRH